MFHYVDLEEGKPFPLKVPHPDDEVITIPSRITKPDNQETP
jgi:hypothetical protein